MNCQHALLSILAASALAPLMGCGGGSTPLPISVSFSGTNSQTIGQGQSVSVTAIVANDSSGKGVSWILTGPGTLSKQTSTSVQYDAPASLPSDETATVTAKSVADPTRKTDYTVNLVAIVVSVSPDNAPDIVVANSGLTLTATV